MWFHLWSKGGRMGNKWLYFPWKWGKHLYFVLWTPYLLLFILITFRHIIFIMIIHTISGHNPNIAFSLQLLVECPHFPPWWLTASITSITGSWSSASQKIPACSFATQTNHLVLYFIALVNGLYIFLYYWKLPLLFFSYLSDFLQ